MKLSLAILISLATLAFGSASRSDLNEKIFKDYGFPSHSGLVRLCGERVYSESGEITWDAFASEDKPSDLIDDYHQKLGDAGLTRDGERGTWRLPAKAARPQRVLEILPVGTNAPYKSCENRPPANTKSIVMVSKLSRH
jgi:hypothetical protein